MRLINARNIKKKAWIEIAEGRHLRLKDIPPDWALGYALHRYFSATTPNPWPLNYSFLRLDCINCEKTTIYDEAFYISDPRSDEGQIGCPNCKYPWLSFKYGGSLG